jgi:1,4-dihydroxy-6-naphthoate synthase
MQLRLAHPADPDGAFAFHGLATGKVDPRGHQIEIVVADLAGLNNLASRGMYEATMLSAHSYALAAGDYVLSAAGGIFGHGTGPVVVSAEPMDPAQLREVTVATAGTTSSAYLVWSLRSPALRTMVLPGDKLLAAVRTGLVPAALIAHSQRMTAHQPGLQVVLDLGQWWCARNEPLALPLHVLGLRRDLPASVQQDLTAMVRDSVRYALANPAEALAAAAGYSPVEDVRLRDHVLGCVTGMTMEMGQAGRDAIQRFLSQGAEGGLLLQPNVLDVVD